MTDTATQGQTAMFRIVIRGSMDDVWAELTKTGVPNETFFNAVMDTTTLGPNAPMRMRTKNGKYTGVVGTVLEHDPPRRFSHTFKFTGFDDPECTVIHDLEEVEGGVQYTIRAENLPVGTKTAKQMQQGSKMIGTTLKSMVENGKPSFGTRLLFCLFRVMEPLSPAASRSEHWPLEGHL